MKTLTFVVASILLIQSSFADDAGVSTRKKCENFLPQQTCDNLRNLAKKLHEKATIIKDAVTDAIVHHKTKAVEMLAYIKGYLAERFPCEKVLTVELCKKIFAIGQKVHLTSHQVRVAIETAVANGTETAMNIYNKAIDFMKNEITCENIFGQQACDNLRDAIKKFHEQRQLLTEAIISAAKTHYNTTIELLKQVKSTIVEKITNFKCEDVLPAVKCNFIRDLATKLHLTAQQVKTAIETAVVNGAQTVIDTYNKTIVFLTTKINCVTILGQQACDNLQQARQKLREQGILIKEAIMAAYVKQVTNVAEVLKKVKETLVEKAKNFKCEDVLPNLQCTQIKSIAAHLKLTAAQLRKAIVESIVNGTKTAKQIYDATIGHLIEDAKNLKCEDLISKATCDTLDAFANRIHIKISEVTMAVKVAIANGKSKVEDIIKYVREYLAEKLSCENFFPIGSIICRTLENLANRLHISFKKIIEKIRSLVASGVTAVHEIRAKVKTYIWDLFLGKIYKRSVDDDLYPFLQKIVDKVLKLVEKMTSVGENVHSRMKAEIKKALESGKYKFYEIKQMVTDLIAKYGKKPDEAISVYRRSIIDDLKEALKNAHGKAKKIIKTLLQQTKVQLEKLKEFLKQYLKTSGQSSDTVDDEFEAAHELLEQMAYQQVDDEVFDAEGEIDNCC